MDAESRQVEAESRLSRLRAMLDARGCDAYVSDAAPQNQYLTGFRGSTSIVLITRKEAVFLCDSRYTEQAQSQVAAYEVQEAEGSLTKAAGELLRRFGASKPAFEPAYMNVSVLLDLEKAFGDALSPEPDLAAQLRQVKTQDEIDRVREAMRLAEGVLADCIEDLEEGVRERDVAARFEYEFKLRGARGPSFDTIALFGPRSSLPHGEPGDRALKRGDAALFDFGCRRDGYCSDLTRTYAFGTIPAAWFEETYNLVLAAQQAALDAIRPGMSGKAVDAIARDIIREGGYGAYFGHGLGHGVGIEIHEAPRLSPSSEVVLEPGMIVTVEPGIYLPGRGGVRIEDVVAVTQDGCSLLSSAPKELRILSV